MFNTSYRFFEFVGACFRCVLIFSAFLFHVEQTLGTLREVVMPQNGIYHLGVKALSDAFKHNTDLEVLNLNDNTLTRKGAAALSEALPLLLKLRVLNLGDSLLKTKGSILIAEALTKHTQLEVCL